MANTDKRTVSTDALETLGTIINENEKRDAIHLAVEPVIAGHYLRAGDHVGFLADGRVGVCDKPLGIVDPFLVNPVEAGERFWLVVYPRQIKSLRHVWEHPDFPSDLVKKSEQWIRDYAEELGLGYGSLMQGAENYIYSREQGDWGEYLSYGGLLEGVSTQPEFWEHYSNVTGKELNPDHKDNFFSCSC